MKLRKVQKRLRDRIAGYEGESKEHKTNLSKLTGFIKPGSNKKK